MFPERAQIWQTGQVRTTTLCMLALAACVPKTPASSQVPEQLAQASEAEDPLKLLDELDALIADGQEAAKERVYAYERAGKLADDGSAGWAFARAALAGRLAELRGAGAGKLVTEAERLCLLAIERDRGFRDGAARRMLGTLYVMAPPRLVEHGDAEKGLEMLEALAKEAPDNAKNRLRVGQAYVHLDDAEPGFEHLCAARNAKQQLPQDEQRLLDALTQDAGGLAELGCAAS